MEIAPVTEESKNPPCHRARGVAAVALSILNIYRKMQQAAVEIYDQVSFSSRSFEREIANRIRRERRERPLQFLGVLGCVGLGLGIVTRIRRSSRG